ncbi:MAG: hypothetical protein JKY65_08680 [Planctomycetes bacterium]|nr:hypothetical protein [Planctomycetota bacterium]
MKTTLAALLLGLLVLGGYTTPLLAQEKKKLVQEYFPLKIGRRWIYTLRVTAGKNTQNIEYTTKVVRKEDVDGLGVCLVTEARSIDRLFATEYYQFDEKKGTLLNPRRTEGKATANFKKRLLLSEKVLADLDKKEQKPTAWPWASADGRAKGTVTVIGREVLRIRNYGNLHCIVLKDKGVFTFRKGKIRRHQERTIWLAPGIGMVKEFMQVKTEEGQVTLETEALLKHHES